MKIAIPNLTNLPWQTRDAVENLEVQIASGWGIEHKGDGTHSDINGDSLTVTNEVTACELRICGPEFIQRDGVLNPPQLTGNTNDYAPLDIQSAYILRISANGAFNITGLQAPYGGLYQRSDFKRICVRNNSGFTITLTHNDAASVAANRFSCPNAANFAMRPNATVWLQYDSFSGAWVVEGV